LTEEMGFEVRY